MRNSTLTSILQFHFHSSNPCIICHLALLLATSPFYSLPCPSTGHLALLLTTQPFYSPPHPTHHPALLLATLPYSPPPPQKKEKRTKFWPQLSKDKTNHHSLGPILTRCG